MNILPNTSHRFCLAPMMDYSDRHCRYLWRLLSKKARLYTEMVTTGALLHGDPQRYLRFHEAEHPLALQLGGNDPQALACCAQLAEQWGYDEVNLNCGCPSDRVQQGMIGASLMAHPGLVADCIKAMRDATQVPVTIKQRIGIDTMDDYPGLEDFVATVAAAGCTHFIVHARKAWLQGLSPKENREVPPLIYHHVYRLKQALPHLTIVINGGIHSIEECQQHLQRVDGVMLGREAYSNPYLLATVDAKLYDADGGETAVPTRRQVAEEYIRYCEGELARGTRLHHMSKHLLGLFQGQKGARSYRRYISENAFKANAGSEVLTAALEKIIDA